jgi:hypothetical protein
MPARTDKAEFFPNQRQVAFADGAEEHWSEFTAGPASVRKAVSSIFQL